jgi:hypothetical protein
MLPHDDRRAMIDQMQPVMNDLRRVSLMKRRAKASKALDAFREYLEITALESRYPGRAAADSADSWEPAFFMAVTGKTRLAKLVKMSTTYVTRQYDVQKELVTPAAIPTIQVFGGLYVFDHNTGHHLFLSNREFYDSVWTKFLDQYHASDVPGKKRLTGAEVARPANPRRLKAQIDSGEYFLRGMPNLEPIPGVGNDESHFLEYVATNLRDRGLPVEIDRIYPRDLQETLVGFNKMQLSATKRTLHLLQAKNVTVSTLYAEILREEVTKVLKSEYANFIDSESNRAVQYIFSKLK